MLYFIWDTDYEFRFTLHFEDHNLDLTDIEVSFDGFAYRQPNNNTKDWLSRHNIKWEWDCNRTPAWVDDYHVLALEPVCKSPIIKFLSESDALLFKLTWDGK